jgi:hypothetical protein
MNIERSLGSSPGIIIVRRLKRNISVKIISGKRNNVSVGAKLDL